ncbi:hypothetical protein [Phytohabitans rumicis]|uniref:Uncharacterized protein n=1 Tax=Phytohabitans rumicis TaxID=1076125 RepID=A0A6V8KZV2_9ACTN|nr:hypothetical protein [Phytohabitans rumicis]GFJ87849.1 hypothetical protein Prum_014910 [Phytohabitans rumicis]
MTHDAHAGLYDATFERACNYARLIGSIRGWLDLTQVDPCFPNLPPISAVKALTEIRRLVDQFDTQPATPGGDRP